jgi:poly(3-hydroxybutyrate) depolymerase
VEAGFVEPSVVAAVGYYVRADHCGTTTKVAVAGSVTETIWACPGGLQVGIAVYQGQDHAWPQSDGATPSAQQVLWDFLAAHGA